MKRNLADSFLNQDCLGVVLAGGKSSRMGTSKALLIRSNDIYGGHSNNQENMLNYSKKLLRNVGIENVVVSGDIEGEPTNNTVIDEFAELGPMGGIYSVIKKYQPKSLLILPVDLPLMSKETLSQLKVKGQLSQKACFFADHFLPLYLPNNGYVEQFFSAHFSQFMQSSNQALNEKKATKKNGPSIRSMLAQVPHHALAIKSAQCLFNTNTPKEWQQAQLRIKG